MKELSQKPDYEMMWKVECELNKELQEQNKTMREALEKISTDTVEVGFYIEPTWTAQIASEALAKVGVLSDNEIFDLAGKICKAIKKDNKFEGKPFGDPIKDGK